ncbi:MAG: MBL fold metallo-hydrolase, partial [Patescibacteria group bacterium]
MQLHFYGGAKTVTGANYLLEAGGLQLLIDCGLFQGSRFNDELNYEPFAYDPSKIDYAIMTHSHTDHVGRLPKLYRDGFRGTVFMTEPTEAIVRVTLYDTMEKIDDESRAIGQEPLYTKREIGQVLKLIKSIRYNESVALNDTVTLTFHEVSHILGSA